MKLPATICDQLEYLLKISYIYIGILQYKHIYTYACKRRVFTILPLYAFKNQVSFSPSCDICLYNRNCARAEMHTYLSTISGRHRLRSCP